MLERFTHYRKKFCKNYKANTGSPSSLPLSISQTNPSSKFWIFLDSFTPWIIFNKQSILLLNRWASWSRGPRVWASCGRGGCCPWFIHTTLLGPVRRTRPQVHRLSIQINFCAVLVCLPVLFSCCPDRYPIYAPVFSWDGSRNQPMRTSHPSGSRHWNFPGKSFHAPGSVEPRKSIGAKPCPMALMPTGFVVLHRNGPDPLWFKA